VKAVSCEVLGKNRCCRPTAIATILDQGEHYASDWAEVLTRVQTYANLNEKRAGDGRLMQLR
jgi:hypothetical protein